MDIIDNEDVEESKVIYATSPEDGGETDENSDKSVEEHEANLDHLRPRILKSECEVQSAMKHVTIFPDDDDDDDDDNNELPIIMNNVSPSTYPSNCNNDVINEMPTNVNNRGIKRRKLFYNESPVNDKSKSERAKKHRSENSEKEGNSNFSKSQEKSVSDNTHGSKSSSARGRKKTKAEVNVRLMFHLIVQVKNEDKEVVVANICLFSGCLFSKRLAPLLEGPC